MLFAFLAVLAAPAPAATPHPPVVIVTPKPDPALVAEAVRLLDAENFDEDAMHSAEVVLEAELATMTEQIHKMTAGPVPEDFLQQMRQILRDHSTATMRANLATIKREAAELYAQEFTRDELIHLRQLAADPVVTKARQRNRVLQPKLLMIGMRPMREAQPELEAKLKRFIADYAAKSQKPGSDQF